MRPARRPMAVLSVAFLLIAANSLCADEKSTLSAVDPATLGAIRDAAMNSDWAYQRLEDLADHIGPRLAGSPGAEAAVAHVAAAMQDIGTQVTLQPCKVPHWVRGEETGELLEYPGRPAGITQRLHLTALGASAATPVAGLTARVVLAHDFDALEAQRQQVKGAIVVFDEHYNQLLADNGMAGQAYGQAGEYRFRGPSAAAEMGAVAVLVRSVGGAEFRLPHTGQTNWKPGQTPVPAGALSAEDADLIARLAAQGPVTMKLTLTPHTLPDADSHNVISDIPGREHPEQVVIVSGHLDSWDLGTGAIDDGMGVTSSMGVAAVLQSLKLKPRRTIRVIAWMNEENGSGGNKAYYASVKDNIATQVAAIESDMGVGRPLGFATTVPPSLGDLFAPVVKALIPIGSTVLEFRSGHLGSDIGPLQEAGVPGFAPIVDGRHYFDYHHTAADTFDKVDSDDLRRQVATLAVMTYYLAEMPEGLSPLPVTSGAH